MFWKKNKKICPRLLRNMRSTTEEYKPSWSPSSFRRKSYKLSLGIFRSCDQDGSLISDISNDKKTVLPLKIVLRWKKICKCKPTSCTSVSSPPLGRFHDSISKLYQLWFKNVCPTRVAHWYRSQSLILLPNNLNTYRHKNMVLRSFSPQRNWNLIWGVAEFSCVMTFHIISMTFLLTKKSHLLSKLRHLKINMEPKNHPLEIRKIICSPTKPPWIFHPWIFWLLKILGCSIIFQDSRPTGQPQEIQQGTQSPKFQNWAPSRYFSAFGRHPPESLELDQSKTRHFGSRGGAWLMEMISIYIIYIYIYTKNPVLLVKICYNMFL